MKATHVFFSLIAACVLFSGVASAELVSGKVLGTDISAKSVEVSRTNPATGAEEKLVIEVPSETTFSGIQSLEQLKAGDEVWVEAEKDNATNSWKATSIEVGAPKGVAEAEAESVAAKPAAQ